MFNFKYALGKIPKGVFVLSLTLLVVAVLLPRIRNLFETTEARRCNIFSGNWSPYPKELYLYDNETCPFILDEKQSCTTAGRPDREYLKYRWKPDDCELPLFDATQFLKLVRGKSMAFIGDSMSRNQIQSLLCLINSVAHLEEVTAKYISKDERFSGWWFSADYNFTVTDLWSPFLVKSVNADPYGAAFNSSMDLYLDEADEAWANRIENFDYVIISAGQWFLRPLTFYENGQVVGCQKCHNMPELNFYGYKKAFRTTFKTIRNLKGFEGLTFLVTHSPKHFENGDFNTGGTCDRENPFTLEEREVYQYGDLMEAFNRIQVEEFATAEKEARKRGLRLGLIDITHAMAMRPDGHPGRHGHLAVENVRVNDCVHWCLPGPVDTWNEFLLHMMKLAR